MSCKALLFSLVCLALGARAAEPVLLERCPKADLPWDATPEMVQEGAQKTCPPIAQAEISLLRQLLSQGANPNVCCMGASVLQIHSAAENPDAVRLLLENGAHPDKPLDSNGGTPLLMALGMGRYEIARYLLAHGADPLQKTDGAATALHELAIGGSHLVRPLSEKMVEAQLQLARQLIRRGVSVNAQVARSRDTPLMVAAVSGNLKLAQLFLEQGADPALRNQRGLTAADLARKQGFMAIADLLLQAGAQAEAEAGSVPAAGLPRKD